MSETSLSLDDHDLLLFISSFYGYGNMAARFWFIGMEEGGGNTLEEVQARLLAWTQLGKPELADLRDFHLLLGMPEFFTSPLKLQHTWMQITRIILTAKGQPNGLEELRAYQKDYLGQKNGESCLMELLPLPSPHTRTWAYNQWSSIPFLATRKSYFEVCSPQRIAHIRECIREIHPQIVIFYGKGYHSIWQTIAGREVKFQDQGGFLVGKNFPTTYLIIKHPSARGTSYAYFENVGAFLLSHLNSR